VIAAVLLWALLVVLLTVAACVLYFGPLPYRDPGPWWHDGRLPARGRRCRARSEATEGRCTRPAGHWWRHDRDADAGDERFVGATAYARLEAVEREQPGSAPGR